MSDAHEQLEHAEHVQHAGHFNKRIALLIAFLALGLAFSETLGKSVQTNALTDNIKASDTWAFFQAKTIRQTVLRTSAEAMAASGSTSPEIAQQIDAWKRTAARYETEPETNEGRRELMARAQAAERDRDLALTKYHQYEFASAAYQIGIVLASSAVITGMIVLVYAAGGLGLLGIALTCFGLFAPEALHDLQHWLEHLFAAGATH